ncbi:hypothetical protein L873DRAFT_1313179 [Choiromyces venosus 120613-1]|uniref:Uncharacterized protein n=1 Tax=Choiromyces venosus 120613-1 TaxID=1336337 RepID=A0A3N4JB75_9PEZI|nr:hypothetical protein L873DRAFT_1313179 [Choiromyces venosus 120613-1]
MQGSRGIEHTRPPLSRMARFHIPHPGQRGSGTTEREGSYYLKKSKECLFPFFSHTCCMFFTLHRIITSSDILCLHVPVDSVDGIMAIKQMDREFVLTAMALAFSYEYSLCTFLIWSSRPTFYRDRG